MSKNRKAKKTRFIEVTMKFWKVFYVEVPEGVTEMDVLGTQLVQDEERGGTSFDVEIEHDDTSTKDEGHKTQIEIESIKRHAKVFSFSEACSG